MTDNVALKNTPVNMLWDKILMLPIFGTIDSARSQEIMETMLKKIVDTKSKIIILKYTLLLKLLMLCLTINRKL